MKGLIQKCVKVREICHQSMYAHMDKLREEGEKENKSRP